MFVFEREQYIHNIGGVRVGGSPGENPTVLIGTIFYKGDKTVIDAEKGLFDADSATNQIQSQVEISRVTGNPTMVQISAESELAMTRYIDFVTDTTDTPFLIDSTLPKVRIAGLKHAEEIGLLDRTIYNSISISVSPEEIKSLSDIGPESAIILAFNPQDPSIAGRRAVLEETTSNLEKGLLSLGEEIGITKPLIDTATTAVGAGAGSSVSFVFVAKTLYGQPTGSGIHNAPSSWTWLRKHRKIDPDAFDFCDVSSSLMILMMAANFVLYGPIKNANKVFPVAAMADVLIAESLILETGLEPPDDHPFRRLP